MWVTAMLRRDLRRDANCTPTIRHGWRISFEVLSPIAGGCCACHFALRYPFARDPEAMSAALLIVDRTIAGFQSRQCRCAAPPATCASYQGGLSFYPPFLPCT
jgi:hypothetical protein